MFTSESRLVWKTGVVRSATVTSTCRRRFGDVAPGRNVTQPSSSVRRPISNCAAQNYDFRENYTQPTAERLTLSSDGPDRQLVIETGAIGRQANGSVLAKHGDTVIYCTVCCAENRSDGGFIPLTVDYVEKLSSVGQTARGYMKRDRQKDSEVLTSRIVDRCLRPMFPNGWSKETQVLETVMSYDGIHSTQPLAITAAGAALALSDIPFTNAVVGVRIGWIDGTVINPSVEEQEKSILDLVLAGTAKGIIMIEANAVFISEENLLTALRSGVEYVTTIAEKLDTWCRSIQKEEMSDGVVAVSSELPDAMFHFAHDRLNEIFSNTNKKQRNIDRDLLLKELVERFVATSKENVTQWTESLIKQAFKVCESRSLRERLLQNGLRIDGRRASDIRPIYSSANVLPTTHGSALFTRGNTQALCVATLGSQKAALRINTLQEEDLQRFYLQYFFPPSSVGEVRRFTLYPGRREIGHGQLASWALAPAMPKFDSFPYTIRLESTITESDGSSSMASVCGGYLAMMDAGVPLTNAVAGIAMGLIIDAETDRYIVLSDIMGTEDALGDMDFKVAGTADGMSAIQMDVKVGGVTFEILSVALKQAKEGIHQILEEMTRCDPPVRCDLSPYAPHIKIIQIDPEANGKVIGPGGKHVRFIQDTAGVDSVTVDDSGEIEIIAHSYEAVQEAEKLIRRAAGEITVGDVIKDAVVSGVRPFGAFVDIAPGRTGLLHISKIASNPVEKIADVVKLGDKVDVQVIACHPNGKYGLSRHPLVEEKEQTLQPRPQMPSVPASSQVKTTTTS